MTGPALPGATATENGAVVENTTTVETNTTNAH
jgi:hypothetical protein